MSDHSAKRSAGRRAAAAQPQSTSRGRQPGPVPEVKIYTDGGCINNPGPGGYGAVLFYKNHRKELSGGFRHTTNNRMEILAAIKGLEALKEACRVTIFSDSQYLVNAIEQGWARRWQAQGWWRNRKEKAINPDLWERLLELCEKHEVKFQWIRGHAGDPGNERADELAREAALGKDLMADGTYESALHHGARS